MRTAVDTNILLDLLIPGAAAGDESERKLDNALESGALVISEPAYAELAALFAQQSDLDTFLAATGIGLEPSNREGLYLAGKALGEYHSRQPSGQTCPQCGVMQVVRCQQCGSNMQPRQHVVADFIIGAQAFVRADALLTRARGYYSTYFPELELV